MHSTLHLSKKWRESLTHCLSSYDSYEKTSKNVIDYYVTEESEKTQSFLKVLEEVIKNKQSSTKNKFLALSLLKDASEKKSDNFADLLSKQEGITKGVYQIAISEPLPVSLSEIGSPLLNKSSSENQGDLDSNRCIRLALECVLYWALNFGASNGATGQKFKFLYQSISKMGAKFPKTFKYFNKQSRKENFEKAKKTTDPPEEIVPSSNESDFSPKYESLLIQKEAKITVKTSFFNDDKSSASVVDRKSALAEFEAALVNLRQSKIEEGKSYVETDLINNPSELRDQLTTFLTCLKQRLQIIWKRAEIFLSGSANKNERQVLQELKEEEQSLKNIEDFVQENFMKFHRSETKQRILDYLCVRAAPLKDADFESNESTDEEHIESLSEDFEKETDLPVGTLDNIPEGERIFSFQQVEIQSSLQMYQSSELSKRNSQATSATEELNDEILKPTLDQNLNKRILKLNIPVKASHSLTFHPVQRNSKDSSISLHSDEMSPALLKDLNSAILKPQSDTPFTLTSDTQTDSNYATRSTKSLSSKEVAEIGRSIQLSSTRSRISKDFVKNNQEKSQDLIKPLQMTVKSDKSSSRSPTEHNKHFNFSKEISQLRVNQTSTRKTKISPTLENIASKIMAKTTPSLTDITDNSEVSGEIKTNSLINKVDHVRKREVSTDRYSHVQDEIYDATWISNGNSVPTTLKSKLTVKAVIPKKEKPDCGCTQLLNHPTERQQQIHVEGPNKSVVVASYRNISSAKNGKNQAKPVSPLVSSLNSRIYLKTEAETAAERSSLIGVVPSSSTSFKVSTHRAFNKLEESLRANGTLNMFKSAGLQGEGVVFENKVLNVTSKFTYLEDADQNRKLLRVFVKLQNKSKDTLEELLIKPLIAPNLVIIHASRLTKSSVGPEKEQTIDFVLGVDQSITISHIELDLTAKKINASTESYIPLGLRIFVPATYFSFVEGVLQIQKEILTTAWTLRKDLVFRSSGKLKINQDAFRTPIHSLKILKNSILITSSALEDSPEYNESYITMAETDTLGEFLYLRFDHYPNTNEVVIRTASSAENDNKAEFLVQSLTFLVGQ